MTDNDSVAAILWICIVYKMTHYNSKFVLPKEVRRRVQYIGVHYIMRQRFMDY